MLTAAKDPALPDLLTASLENLNKSTPDCAKLHGSGSSMAASALAVNSSLLPSQSIFMEVQSIHDTGFFQEIESILKESTQHPASSVRDACCSLHA